MIVKQIAVGPMQNFVYLLGDELTREALVVDSGWETNSIVKQAEVQGLRVNFVVATHEHYDHVSTVAELAGRLGAQVVSHEVSPVPASVRVKHGDELFLGRVAVRVLHTPGHTRDSICLFDGENLFTGDTLFVDSWGRTDLPGGSAADLFRSLHEIILKLPPRTMIYPGHDYGEVPSRKLAEESEVNPALLARDLGEFLSLTQS